MPPPHAKGFYLAIPENGRLAKKNLEDVTQLFHL
jgi:hypothetical protein